MKIVALLESMWGWGGYNDAGEEAPRYFRINPRNLSGSRLYKLCDPQTLLVTNCCRYVQRTANDHGKPDLVWIRENLKFLRKEGMGLLLVCGRIAKDSYFDCGFNFDPVMFIDHPAARRWSNEKFNSVRQEIQSHAFASTTKS